MYAGQKKKEQHLVIGMAVGSGGASLSAVVMRQLQHADAPPQSGCFPAGISISTLKVASCGGWPRVLPTIVHSPNGVRQEKLLWIHHGMVMANEIQHRFHLFNEPAFTQRCGQDVQTPATKPDQGGCDYYYYYYYYYY